MFFLFRGGLASCLKVVPNSQKYMPAACLCSKLTAFLWNELAFGKMASLFFFRVFFSTFHILYDVIETLMLDIPQKFATLQMNHKTSAIHY